MANVPEAPVVDWHQKLQQWYLKAEELRKLRAHEIMLRKEIAEHFFPSAEEGTSRADIGDGYELVQSLSYDRKVEADVLSALREKLEDAEIVVDEVFRFKPELNKRAYNALDDDQTALVEQVLTTKPGTPSLKIDLSTAEKARRAKQADEEIAAANARVTDVTAQHTIEDDDIPF